jgi:nicotinamidase/pyrazinamidase
VIEVINEFSKKFQFVYKSRDWHPADHCSFQPNNPGSTLFNTFTLENGVEQIMWPIHCVQGTPGADYHPELRREAADIEILKGMDKMVD